MSDEWNVAGSILVRTKKTGKRAAVESSMDEILMGAGLYLEGKYGKGIEIKTSSPVLNQRLSERLKA